MVASFKSAGPKNVEGAETLAPCVPVRQDDTLLQVVRDVNRAFARTVQARIASYGVSMGHWFFLRALWEEDGLTQRQLSHRAGMMEPTTVTAINAMEEQDLVQRVRNAHDRRKVNVFLTAKGRALRDEVLPGVADIATQATRGVESQEIAQAIDILRRIGTNLGVTAGERSPFALDQD
ncbi:MarR family winged helix-turn-helix transcriptional regulator [Azospirillum thermophilum]|uniref:MarR family transcriptional regulator n=1 Tax=Azospirillum thermophilum TaxID=2202148 RepID=A0A2S2CRQ7_9PROT|nr:MarR family winged helix-turn-helix transcriptional regulator [Azospirillum thermophilum]AWK86977.1 MarR family transcriptional regulator [Azospirillum thermophilum]